VTGYAPSAEWVPTLAVISTQWIHGEIVLRHKKKAKSKVERDPVQKLGTLEAANAAPVTITRDANFQDAITLMMMHDYSQLPVMGSKTIVSGYVSWDTIGKALAYGKKPEMVKDVMATDVVILDPDTPLLEAISKVHDIGFVVVQRSDKSLAGIVTTTDISKQFLTIAEPFLLLEQIEIHIRQILDGKFLVDEIRAFFSSKVAGEGSGPTPEIVHIDDLTFGQYKLLMENPDNWNRLSLPIERAYFITQLDKIREIRNDVMHFDPEGLTMDQLTDLRKMAKFLKDLRKLV
jgi:CBS domain-containing protein